MKILKKKQVQALIKEFIDYHKKGMQHLMMDIDELILCVDIEVIVSVLTQSRDPQEQTPIEVEVVVDDVALFDEVSLVEFNEDEVEEWIIEAIKSI